MLEPKIDPLGTLDELAETEATFSARFESNRTYLLISVMFELTKQRIFNHLAQDFIILSEIVISPYRFSKKTSTRKHVKEPLHEFI